MDEQGLSPEGDDFEAEDNVLPLPAEELTESQLRALVSAGGNPAGLLTPLQQQQHAPTGRPGGSGTWCSTTHTAGSERTQIVSPVVSPGPRPNFAQAAQQRHAHESRAMKNSPRRGPTTPSNPPQRCGGSGTTTTTTSANAAAAAN